MGVMKEYYEAEIEKAYKNSDEVQYRKGFEDGVASVKTEEWSEKDEAMEQNVYESLYAYQCDIRAGRMDKNASELLDDVDAEAADLSFFQGDVEIGLRLL